MNFLGWIILLAVAAFAGYQIYGLVKDFRERKRKAKKRAERNEQSKY